MLHHGPHVAATLAIAVLLANQVTGASAHPAASYSAAPGGGTGSVRGFVTDSTSGETLPGANVLLVGTSQGTVTDNRGYYALAAVPEGACSLKVSFIGYRTKTVFVAVRGDEILQKNVSLAPIGVQLQELVVTQERSASMRGAVLGLESLTSAQVRRVPAGIESDALRALQATPGVSTIGDLSSRYYVRGGGSDQNLMMLDGVTVYSPFHALGIFSVIDPEMVSVVEFYKGGYPPSMGGRLSSVLNVVTRDGNRNDFHAAAFASLLAGKVTLEGPTPGGSVLLTARKSYYGRILKNYVRGQDVPFDFYDVSFRANYSNPSLDNNGKLIIHGFLSGDRVQNHNPLQEDYALHSAIVGVIWQKVWQSPLVSSANLSYSGFNADVLPNLSKSNPAANTVRDVSLNWDFTYFYPSRDEIGFGLQNKILATDLSLVNTYNRPVGLQEQGWEMCGYVDYRFRRWESLTLDIGGRLKLLTLADYRTLPLEPRIGASCTLTPSIVLKGFAGWCSQDVTTLSNEDEVISIFEPWVIVPSNVAAPTAALVSLGATMYATDEITVSVEGYYRPMFNLIEENPRKYEASDPDYTNLDGKSYGAESMVRFGSGPAYVQAAYSLAWAFLLRTSGMDVPRYDIRHSVSLLAALEVGSGWQANAMWTLRSGLPFTPIAGFYDRLNINPLSTTSPYSTGPEILWGAKNSSRLPVYHRLDVSVAKRFALDPAAITVSGSIINVYDQKNLFYFDRDTGARIYMLRFSPSVSLKVEI